MIWRLLALTGDPSGPAAFRKGAVVDGVLERVAGMGEVDLARVSFDLLLGVDLLALLLFLGVSRDRVRFVVAISSSL